MSREDIDELLERLRRVRIQEEDLIERIVAARARETETTSGTQARSFKIGDRVKITNRIKYFGRAQNAGDENGTVTKITAKRVHILTDNGILTNRDPKNLRHLSP